MKPHYSAQRTTVASSTTSATRLSSKRLCSTAKDLSGTVLVTISRVELLTSRVLNVKRAL